MITEGFVTDKNGNKISIIVPIKKFKRLILKLEELKDINLYDEVKTKKGISISVEEYIKSKKKK